MPRKDTNVLIFTGNLMADPSMRYTPTGAAVTTLIVACNDTYKKATGDPVETMVKYKVAAWNKQAEICNQYLHKGDQVLITGRPFTSEQEGPNRGTPHIWTGQDGSPRADFEVKLDNIQFLQKAGAGKNGSAAASAPAAPAEEQPPAGGEDEFPF
ncbi:MAG: single-stranded DNA-binding protein [Anaerolineales bacterium]